MVDKVGVGCEHPVREPVIAHELPDVLGGVELRAFGRERHSVMLSGSTRPAERCHPAWSTTSTACLSGATSAAISARCRFIASVLQAGRTSAAPLPSRGQIAPKM